MKRANLVLDEHALEEAVRTLGERTYSATVNRALVDAVRWKKIRALGASFGSKVWEGDLGEMREDKPRRGRR
jgi:Arc/MetJ family transcription regulator